MPQDPPSNRRAFVTCSARGATPVGPLLAEVELLLQGMGWRTRVPGRIEAGAGMDLDERRRLASTARRDVERASVVVHVPAPAHVAGTTLHRELAQARGAGVPILIAVAAADRERLGVGLPSPQRIAELVARTQGHVVERLPDLAALAERIARG